MDKYNSGSFVDYSSKVLCLLASPIWSGGSHIRAENCSLRTICPKL